MARLALIPRLAGVTLVAGVVVLGVVSVILSTPPGMTRLDASLLVLGCSLPLALRRRRPVLALALAAPFALILAVSGATIPAVAGPGLLLIAVGESVSPWAGERVAWPALLGLLAALVVIQRLQLPSEGWVAGSLLSAVLLWAAALYFGVQTRQRRDHLRQVADEADDLRERLERERRLSAAEERTRLARDLHDEIGHAVNVIAIHAGAARLQLDRDPERSRQSLEAIEQTARAASEELDALVGVLRGDDAPSTLPTPGASHIPDLVDSYRAAGLNVTLRQTGTPTHVSAAIGATAYRVVQEALTNASRHGTGAVTLSITHAPDQLHVDVENDVHDPAPTGSNGGRGIVGMVERVQLVGGTLSTQVASDRFAVHATFPNTSHRP